MKIVLSRNEATFENIRNKLESYPPGTSVSFPYNAKEVEKLINYLKKDYETENIDLTIQSSGTAQNPHATFRIAGELRYKSESHNWHYDSQM